MVRLEDDAALLTCDNRTRKDWVVYTTFSGAAS
jgi:hypothetical protein